MAVTKLLRLKECSRGNKAQHLKNNLRYIMDPKKTNDGLNIGGNAGVTWDWVYESMMENKHYWHKEDGSQGFHYVISFPPEAGVSMQTAHNVAQEFCERLLGDNYYYVYAIHDDKPHLHIHVTFDSVSRLTGLKYHSPHGDWEKRIQPITDDICRKFDLPLLTFGPERSGTSYKSWQDVETAGDASKDKNAVSWNDIIRDDIDEGIGKTSSYEEFLSWLKVRHYEVRDGKYLSLKPYGKPKAVRTRSLGAGYGKEEIIERISMEKKPEKRYRVYGDVESIRLLFIKKRYGKTSFHLTPFQRSFYLRWKNTCFIRRPDFKDAWKYKKDVLKLQEISDRIRYLLEYEIATPEDLLARKADLEKERKAAMSAFYAAKRKLYKDPLCVLVKEREKLLQKQQSGEDLSQRIAEADIAIRKRMSVPDAEALFRDRKENYDRCKILIRNLKKESQLVSGIADETEAYLSLQEDIKRDQVEVPDPEVKREDTYQQNYEERRRD